MARSITREDPEGGVALCCPREGESRVYRTNAGLDLCPRLGELRGPFVFISSDPDAPGALAPGKVGRAMKEDHGIDWTPIAGTSHLLQIERPDACHAALEAFLARACARLARGQRPSACMSSGKMRPCSTIVSPSSVSVQPLSGMSIWHSVSLSPPTSVLGPVENRTLP